MLVPSTFYFPRNILFLGYLQVLSVLYWFWVHMTDNFCGRKWPLNYLNYYNFPVRFSYSELKTVWIFPWLNMYSYAPVCFETRKKKSACPVCGALPHSFHPTVQDREWIYKIFSQNLAWSCIISGRFLLISQKHHEKQREQRCLFSWIESSYACSSLSLGTDKTYPWVYWSANKNWKEFSLKACVWEGILRKSVPLSPLPSPPPNKQHRTKVCGCGGWVLGVRAGVCSLCVCFLKHPFISCFKHSGRWLSLCTPSEEMPPGYTQISWNKKAAFPMWKVTGSYRGACCLLLYS